MSSPHALITKPMLAATLDHSKARYPYLATPKVDGIRFLIVGGQAVSRSFKPIRNKHIQSHLARHLPEGMDGEITCGNFQESTSGVMATKGEPQFTVWVFDYVKDSLTKPYKDRLNDLRVWRQGTEPPPFDLRVLSDTQPVNCEADVMSVAQEYMRQGFEGAMLRSPDGPYKCGRATVKENIILKVKDFVDEEATVIAFVELLHNTNEATRDAFDRAKRSSHKAGKEEAGKLGALLVTSRGGSLPEGTVFKIGSGFTDQQRHEIWQAQSKYMGAVVKYKSMAHGVKDKPRHPVFLGWRHTDDL
jgi:DNA ligase-1